jgi:hypothetical protein
VAGLVMRMTPPEIQYYMGCTTHTTWAIITRAASKDRSLRSVLRFTVIGSYVLFSLSLLTYLVSCMLLMVPRIVSLG